MKKTELMRKAAESYPEIFDAELIDTVQEGDIPDPALWKILVLPAMPKTKTAGGILLADDSKEAEKYNNHRSLVLSVGPLAYKDPNRFKEHPDATTTVAGCKPGDFIAHGKYAGQKIQVGEVVMMFLNDDEISGIIPNPAALAAYV